MKDLIKGVFDFAAMAFDKMPMLKKFSGYRSLVGFVGLAVVAFLKTKGMLDADVLKALEYGFIGFTALSLNAKGRK